MKKAQDQNNIGQATPARPMALTVKAVVVGSEGKILLLKRTPGDINGGKWDLPGGGVDEGEEIIVALKREVKEETGLSVEAGPLLRISEFFRRNGENLEEKRGVRFLAFAQEQEQGVEVSSEHSDFVWVRPEEALGYFSNQDGFEKEKKETILSAMNHLKKEEALAGWQRALADLENFKRRTQKNNEEFKAYCLEDLFLEIVPVLDNFEAAWEHLPEDKKKDNLLVGFFHIKNQLQKVLWDRGLAEIPVKPGDKFDENRHEALAAGPAGKNQGKIKKILKKGYLLGGKVIRPAGVEVG
mgnify:CR=1 FL=1